MPNSLTPFFTRWIPAPVRKFLTALTNILIKGREITGAYSKGPKDLGDGGQSGPR